MRSFIVYLPFFYWLTSCTPRSAESPLRAERDVIMQKYFHILDSLPLRDTLWDDNFRLLKAYYRHDTAYLNEEYTNLTTYLKSRSRNYRPTPCTDSPPLQHLDYDEVYRFSYSAGLCTDRIDLTIGEKKDAYTLTVKLDSMNISAGKCITKQFSKHIPQWVWEEFKQEIYYVDFWGMREQSGLQGDDGTSLRAYGYKKSYNGRYKLKAIDRWLPEHLAVGRLLKKVFDLSEIKGTCLNNSMNHSLQEYHVPKSFQ